MTLNKKMVWVVEGRDREMVFSPTGWSQKVIDGDEHDDEGAALKELHRIEAAGLWDRADLRTSQRVSKKVPRV